LRELNVVEESPTCQAKEVQTLAQLSTYTFLRSDFKNILEWTIYKSTMHSTNTCYQQLIILLMDRFPISTKRATAMPNKLRGNNDHDGDS